MHRGPPSPLSPRPPRLAPTSRVLAGAADQVDAAVPSPGLVIACCRRASSPSRPTCRLRGRSHVRLGPRYRPSSHPLRSSICYALARPDAPLARFRARLAARSRVRTAEGVASGVGVALPQRSAHGGKSRRGARARRRGDAPCLAREGSRWCRPAVCVLRASVAKGAGRSVWGRKRALVRAAATRSMERAGSAGRDGRWRLVARGVCAWVCSWESCMVRVAVWWFGQPWRVCGA